MLVDFQHHYMPAGLMPAAGEPELRTDKNGNPNYRFHPLLADLPSHIRMMNTAGIDVAVLSCGAGFDQPELEVCRYINDDLCSVRRTYKGRFLGLAHVPALEAAIAVPELRRCALQLGFPGVVITSEVGGQPLDSESLMPFWKAAADLGLYVFIHPPPRVIDWPLMDSDDLGRMLGWEFSLAVCATRLINSGLLDRFPDLKIQFSHFGGGIGRYLPRIMGMQSRKLGSVNMPIKHCRTPAKAFESYLQERLFYDCAGWVAQPQASDVGEAWVRAGLGELTKSQVVFGTDYPQACDDDVEIASLILQLTKFGKPAADMLNGTNASALVPFLKPTCVPQII